MGDEEGDMEWVGRVIGRGMEIGDMSDLTKF